MQHFRNILVGVDLASGERWAASELTPHTHEAIARALWLAERNKARLTLLAALDLSAQTLELIEQEVANGAPNVEVEAGNVLNEFVERARSKGIDAQPRLVIGKAWLEIIHEVLRQKHDLVIVGSHRAGTIERRLFGGTVMKLLHKCPCPVWVTRPDPNWNDLNILVPSDLGPVSQNALSIAVGLAKLTEAAHSSIALHRRAVRGTHPPYRRVARALERSARKTREEREARLHDQLSRTDYRTLTHGLQAHVEEGAADAGILKAIDAFNIDLVVMGTASQGGIGAALLGNTAERLLPRIGCSLVAVKPDDFQCPVTLD